MTNAFKDANKNIKPLVISFYTLNTPYEQEVSRLINSCKKFNVEHSIEGIPSQGSWEKNCGFKPLFILKKLEEFKRPLLWVDADGAFLQPPHLESFLDYDFSVRIGKFVPDHDLSKVISNTVFINYTPTALSLIKRWAKGCENSLKKDPKTWDQEVLRDLILKEKRAKILPMPLAYSKIFDLDSLYIKQTNVIIEHYQASRFIRCS